MLSRDVNFQILGQSLVAREFTYLAKIANLAIVAV